MQHMIISHEINYSETKVFSKHI